MGSSIAGRRVEKAYGALRLRLMRVIQDSMYPNGNTTCNPRSPFARLFFHQPYLPFSTLRKWTWVASFFPLPPGTLAHRWSMAKWLSKCALPDRWKDYLQSWRDITDTKADVNRHCEQRVLEGDLGLLGATNACDLLQIPSLEKNAMGSVHLVRQARACHQYSLLCSPLPLTSHPSSKKWKRWWTDLRKLREKLPREEDTFHLLALGRLISPAKWSKNPPDPRCPNNVGPECCLCASGETECPSHLFLDCSASTAVWRTAFPALHCPTNFSNLLGLAGPQIEAAAGAACYIDTRWMLAKTRRLQSSPPVPLTDEDFMVMGKAIVRRCSF